MPFSRHRRNRATVSVGFATAWTIVALLLFSSACGSMAVRRVSSAKREYPAGVVHLRWRTAIHPRGLFEPRPEECSTGVIVGSRLIIGSRAAKLVALDVADGRVLWTTPLSGSVDSELRYDENRRQVYVGTDDGSVYAVEPDKGTVRWSYRGNGAVERRPEFGPDTVYVTTAADRVYALDASNGKHRWQYEREAPEGFTIHGHAGARLQGGVLYVGFSDGYLVALQATEGEVLWARSLAAASEQFVDVDSTPVLHKELVFASSYSGGLFALRARDGETVWRQSIEGASAVRIVDGRLYVAAPRDGLAALTSAGHVLWRQGLAEAGDLTAPQSTGPYLVFTGSRAGLFVIDRASGRLLQLFNPGRGMCAAPTLADGGRRLYALANSGSVYALDLAW